MKRLLILIKLITIVPAMALAQNQNYWQQQVDYNIAVTLNDVDNTLEGKVNMLYTNKSPDTLRFIWIHLWPNAYKNDKTAYSEQKLQMKQTDFYFSNAKQRGYINRLNFTVNGQLARMEDHPEHIDAAKVWLPQPLAPGQQAAISTPFFVKLPYKFSRGGYAEQNYSCTQWFPKAAVYDATGWHVMPYLEWGEYYSNFGNYTVSITLPANYAVAATGVLQDETEREWLKNRSQKIVVAALPTAKRNIYVKQKLPRFPPSAAQTKTLLYQAQQVVDFAWFADKRFMVKYDTMQLGNKSIDVWNFILPDYEKMWAQSMAYSKRAIGFYSQALGQYPYPQVTVVCDETSSDDGMEYPMITSLNTVNGTQQDHDILISHEIGHNWLMGVLATNERDFPWMDEGINTYFERRYQQQFYGENNSANTRGLAKKLPSPTQTGAFMLSRLINNHKDQPINTTSEKFSYDSYYLVSYYKAAFWLEKMEQELGAPTMERIMKTYYDQWQFKHPTPYDFKAVAEKVSGKNLDTTFLLLQQTGNLNKPLPTSTKVTGLFNFNHTDKYRYISLAPAAGANQYDGLQLGLLVHNRNLPSRPFEFVAAPLFATNSKQLTGYAHAAYHVWSGDKRRKTTFSAQAARFNFNEGRTVDNQKVFAAFTKLVPGVTVAFQPKEAHSTLQRTANLRLYVINEQRMSQALNPADSLFYDFNNGSTTTVIPQLTMAWENTRQLYPWRVQVGVQQIKQLMRTTVEARYFLNFNARDEGVAIRVFAGKILYTQEKTTALRNSLSRYHFTMYAPNGAQDYTYSAPFYERSQNTNLAGRQIAPRDGGFKYRSDYSSVQPGLKTNGIDYFDNWLASVNFTLDVPAAWNPLMQLPAQIPVKVFADIGTSASPWQIGSNQNKFLYSAGLQVTILRAINIYYPLLQSKAFNEPNSVNDPNRAGGPSWWQKRLTFSIDLGALKTNRIAGIPAFD
ncbi:MAG: M1 family peptidase [Bacteroidetes bacterium]|nr:MAG: M1 family peptidase [Bacteroidota bacterium]